MDKVDRNRYEVLIEKIKSEPSLKTKVDDLAVMVFMIAKHDLNSICQGFDGLHDKLDLTIKSLKAEQSAAQLACHTELAARITSNKKHINKLFVGVIGIIIILAVTHPDIIGLIGKLIELIF